METWKPIPGFESYEVSDFGKVRSLLTGRILKPGTDRGGYHYVSLQKDGNGHSKKVHRLVALAFIPQTGPMINHKNEDKTDNRVCNLEWCDKRYNNTYGTVRDRIRRTLGKRVMQLSLSGEVMAVFDSMQYASTMTGVNYRHIQFMCNHPDGERKSAGGFVWKYE